MNNEAVPTQTIAEIVNDMTEMAWEGGPGEITAVGYKNMAEEIDTAHKIPFKRIEDIIQNVMFEAFGPKGVDDAKSGLREILTICREELGTLPLTTTSGSI